jgi:hypothetical protein
MAASFAIKATVSFITTADMPLRAADQILSSARE